MALERLSTISPRCAASVSLNCGGSLIDLYSSWAANSDYAIYWSAFHLLKDGYNAFDLQTLNTFEQSHGLRLSGPFLGSPLALVLLAPFLILPFHLSFALFISSILAASWHAINTWALINNYTRSPLLLAASGFLFIPFLYALNAGQISPLVLCFLLATLCLLKKEQYLAAGLTLSLTIIKPQMAFLFVISSFFWAVKNREWEMITGMILGTIALLICSYLLFPDVFTLAAASQNSPLIWMSASLVTPFRFLTEGTLGIWTSALLLPLLASLVTAYFSGRSRISPITNVRGLITGSLITAPYLWVFEYTALIPLQIDLLLAPGRNRSLRLLAVAALQLILFVFGLYDIADWRLCWFPPVLYLLSSMFKEKHSNSSSSGND